MTDETTSGPAEPSTRDRLIEAAIDIVFEDGARKLSLNAVAERAGVSKGGLLYHFKSKSDLLKAMVAMHMESLEQAVHQAHAQTSSDGRPNAFIRAFIKASNDELCGVQKPYTGFLAAIAEQPDLLNPVRTFQAKFLAEVLDKSENPHLAQTAFLAIAGARHLQLFDINPFTPDDLRAQFDHLTDLLAHPTAE